jgi:O-antigen/teichoic acid export membrane protein
MAVSVVLLNKWLINLIGINGAALATFIVMAVYSFVKIVFIQSKLKIQPFEVNTIKILLLIGSFYFIFGFWNFELHPVFNIFFKSIFIVVSYLFFVRKFHISKDITVEFNKFFNRK